MPLAEARTILGEPFDAVEHDVERDIERLRELAVTCRQFSPVCGIDDNDSPDSLLLDISGCGHLFGGDQGLGEEAIRVLASLGYRVQVGIAATVGVAWAAARAARENVCVISADGQRQWFDRCPVGALRIENKTADGLSEFDLRTVGQVRNLPREQLPSRFGETLLRRLDQADGKLPEPIVPVLPVETPRVLWQSEYPLRRPDLLDIVVERLAGQLAGHLPDGVGITKLVVTIQAGQQAVSIDVAFARPTCDSKRLIELISLRMERLVVPSGIDRVRMEAKQLDIITRRQTNLFGDPLDGEGNREFSDLIEQLSCRLGEDRVCYARLTPDPLPERSVEWTPAVAGDSKADSATPPLMSRPMVLLPQPTPVRLWVFDHKPTRVEYQGQLRDVAHVWGPERIESGWWRDDYQQRDYYRVELTSGECLWLFWTADSGNWFLHGVF